MKILFLGEIGLGQTSHMRMRALQRLGHKVRGVHTIEPWKRASWFMRQLQRRSRSGSIIDEINRQALESARDFRPDLVWAEKQEYLRRQTLEDIKALGCRLVHFTPDPYFSLDWKRTPLMDRALGAFDVLVYCKAYERCAYEQLQKLLVYMPLGYCDEVHRPLPSDDPHWRCDVGFLGGWDPRRERMMSAIVATDANVKIRGVGWEFLRDGRWSLRRYLILRQLAGKERFSIRRDPSLAAAYQGDEVYADDYARALTGARIGLGFLRTVWPDQHTTRSFEIPACGSMLLADRTDEHCGFFEEGKDAEFFSSEAELRDKLSFYLAHEPARARMAAAGLERCRTGRYAYVHRMADALAAMGKAR
jgi:spore maturation protein CgeB